MYLGVIICSIASLLMILLGYLIWAKKKLFLIAGYDEETFVGDKEKLAKAMGMFSIFVGILIFIFPFTLEYIGSFTGYIFAIIIVLGTMVMFIYVNMLNRK
ncbi:DUF3784 domain-containing protein [Parageobacillus thermoglucosidasius]|uniref:DUF3784 domain-containing protein n=1 Tax=Parageobacillus thermoglucosidasius TaxID=1426 RepID=UPI0027F2E1FC|nr:DUF3784 domain-containing protein [Parageobacillus thermoglucosidasius]